MLLLLRPTRPPGSRLGRTRPPLLQAALVLRGQVPAVAQVLHAVPRPMLLLLCGRPTHPPGSRLRRTRPPLLRAALVLRGRVPAVAQVLHAVPRPMLLLLAPARQQAR